MKSFVKYGKSRYMSAYNHVVLATVAHRACLLPRAAEEGGWGARAPPF